jgi:hypothetical protein
MFTVPTFKYVLSDDVTRKSFFQAFIPGVVIKKSDMVDEHMSTITISQFLRRLLNLKKNIVSAKLFRDKKL